MRRFLLLGIAVLLVLARAAIDGAPAPARAERAGHPSYWEAIIQGRIRPG